MTTGLLVQAVVLGLAGIVVGIVGMSDLTATKATERRFVTVAAALLGLAVISGITAGWVWGITGEGVRS